MKERTIKRTQPTARGIRTIRIEYVKQGRGSGQPEAALQLP
jgi:hypothetical protein